MPTITLAANETSDPIEVPPLKLLGIDTDKPVTITTGDGSVLAKPVFRHALNLIPPTDTIVLIAGSEGAEVIVTLTEEE